MKTIFLILLLCVGCNDIKKEEYRIQPLNHSDHYNDLANRYSKDAFNYLFELCFYDEFQNTVFTLSKWDNDIKFYISGEHSARDLRIVEMVIEKLENLDLPIRFYLVTDAHNSNVIIHFGDSLALKPLGFIKGNLGMAFRTSRNGIIFQGKILILNDSVNDVSKESVLLEEMTQIIGSITDSFTYPKSLFYQGINNTKEYEAIDVEILKLLYDTLIPYNYSIEDYQKDFSEVIDYVDTSNKLRKIFTTWGIEESILKQIRNTCYINGEFYKHPKEIPVYLDGFNHSDSVLVLESLEFFNGLSDNLNLKLGSKLKEIPSTGITIKLLVNDSQDHPTETRISNVKGEVFKPKRIESIAEISYRSSVELKKKRSVILKAIYKSLGPTEMHFEDDWFTYEGEKVIIQQKYADIVRVIYSDEFVDGYPLEEFEELIKSF